MPAPLPSSASLLGILGLGLAVAVAWARLPEPPDPLPLHAPPRLLAPDGAVVDTLAEAAGLPPLAVEHLLDPALLEELAGDCPARDPALGLLCAPASRANATEALDGALARALGDDDPLMAAWARELSAELGPRGTAIAERALAGGAAAPEPLRQQAAAVVVLAWTLPREAARARLRPLLEGPPELALPAALELARLEADPEALQALARRLGEGPDALLARYAASIAAGSVYAELPAGL